jgi:outer membrane protein assembly factor BamB
VIFPARANAPAQESSGEPKVFRRFTTNAGRPSLPAVADGVMYAGDAEGNLYAFDVETGERLWYHQHHDDRYSMRIERMSAVTPDLVIIEAGGRVLAMPDLMER